MKRPLDRPKFPGRHPVELRGSIFLTPPIEAMKKAVKGWMDSGISGGLIFGHQRYGKTRAVRALVQQWSLITKSRMPAYYLDVRTRSVPNEDGFFEDLLSGMRHQFPSKGKAKDKRNRARDFLICEAERAESDTVMLTIDNAHRLSTIHYDWLCNLFDELDDANILAFTLSVGEPDLKSIRDGFESSGQMQSVGRFMVEEHWFHGIRRQAELESLFGWFDAKVFPDNSGWTYSRYYYPEAFDNGWRLRNEAPVVWALWDEVRRRRDLGASLEIPMVYLAAVTKQFLRRGDELDREKFLGGESIWRPLISQCGYAKAARYVRVITGDDDDHSAT